MFSSEGIVIMFDASSNKILCLSLNKQCSGCWATAVSPIIGFIMSIPSIRGCWASSSSLREQDWECIGSSLIVVESDNAMVLITVLSLIKFDSTIDSLSSSKLFVLFADVEWFLE